jgi:hypothetical protein
MLKMVRIVIERKTVVHVTKLKYLQKRKGFRISGFDKKFWEEIIAYFP